MKTIDKLLDIKKMIGDGLAGNAELLSQVLQEEVPRNYLFETLFVKDFNPEDFIFLYKQNGFSSEFVPSELKAITINGKPKEILQSWAATKYLKKASDYTVKSPNEEITRALREIIYAYITYVLSNRTQGIHSFDDATIGTIILNLPLEFVFNDQNFEFIRQRCLNDPYLTICDEIITVFYPRVLQEKNRKVALQTIKLLFDFEVQHRGFRSVDSKVQEYYLKDFVKKFASESFDLLGLRLTKLLFDLIEDINTVDNYAFTSLYINSLFKESQDDYIEKLSVIIITFLKVGLQRLTQSDMPATLQLLNYYDDSIFNRIGLFIVGNFYEMNEVYDYFWTLNNPLNNFDAENELKFFINKYRGRFNQEKTKKFKEWIEGIRVFRYDNESDEEYKERSQGIRSNWEHILNAGYIEHELLGDEVIFQSVERFPIEAKRIYNVSDEIILSLFQSAEDWGGYNQSGLTADILQLDPIRKEGLLSRKEAINYLPEVLWALINSIEIQENKNWNPLFELLSKLLKEEKFWDFLGPVKNSENPRQEYRSNYNKDLWKAVANIFRQAAGMRKPSYFSLGDSEHAISLLMRIEPKVPNAFKILNVNQEYIDAINTVKGNIFDAMITIAVSIAVIKETKEFYEPVKKFFESKLRKEDPPEELLWVLGGNLVKIGYMDLDWIEANKPILFQTPIAKDLKVLKAHLIYTSTVYKDLYLILWEYYYKAIFLFSRDKSEKSNHAAKLIQHICISRANYWPRSQELLEDVIASPYNEFYLQEIIKHFGRQSTGGSDNKASKNIEFIPSLWRELIEELRIEQSAEKQEMATNLLKWVENFNNLTDEIVALVYANLDIIENYPFDYHLMAYLEKMSIRFPEIIGKIVSNGLEKSNGFDLTGNQRLHNITENLYKQGVWDEADNIVSLLTDRNRFFLVDLYESKHYNKI